MKKNYILIILVFTSALCSLSFKKSKDSSLYISYYHKQLKDFNANQLSLLNLIKQTDIATQAGIEKVKKQIGITRTNLKGLDFWLRYVEPIAYKKINGPLPVEWETEVFEKFEKPYRREGSGLTLAERQFNTFNTVFHYSCRRLYGRFHCQPVAITSSFLSG